MALTRQPASQMETAKHFTVVVEESHKIHKVLPIDKIYIPQVYTVIHCINDRIAEFGRHPWTSSGPTYSHQRQLDYSSWVLNIILNILQRWTPTTSPGNLFHCSITVISFYFSHEPECYFS